MATDIAQEPQRNKDESQDSFLDNKKTELPIEGEDITLKRVLGIPGASSMVAGIMIGSGIFISGRWVLVYSGSVGLALFLWLLCGLVSFIGGLCWTELGLTFPKCGGEYILIKETLGPVPAFAIVWLKLIFVFPSSSAITLLTLASYFVDSIFPGCADREDLVPVIKITAACAGCILCLLNCLSATWSARVQIVFTAAKILALVILIITGFVSLGQGNTASFHDPFKDTTSQIGMIGLAFQSGLWAYEGWDALDDVTEEIKRPVRNMPWAVLGSIVTVTSCYLLVNVAYLAVLTPQEVKASPATAVALGYRVYGAAVARVIPLFVAASVFGSENGSMYGYGRLEAFLPTTFFKVVFSAAREGHLPSFMAMIHRTKRTPIFAMLIKTLLACLLLIPDKSSIKTLLSLYSTAEWITYLITVIGLLWTRYKRPQLKRPFKLPIVIPIVFLLISLYLTITPFIKAPFESSMSVVLMLTGLPVYYFFIHLKATPKCVLRCVDWIAFKSQLLLDVRYPTSIVEIGS